MKDSHNTSQNNYDSAAGTQRGRFFLCPEFAAGSSRVSSHGSSRRRALAAALAFLLVVTLWGGFYPGAPDTEAYAANLGDFSLTRDDGNPPEAGADYTFASGILSIKSTKAMTVRMSSAVSGYTANTIYIDASSNVANITLDDVKIDVASSSPAKCAFNVASADLNLTLSGENELISGEDRAGLQLIKSANLTINTGTQPGSLKAVGSATGANSGTGVGAGIGAGGTGAGGGSSEDDRAGNITILGGGISAKSNGSGVGIGGDSSGDKIGGIQISGGYISVSGGTSSVNDIEGSNVTIDGGSVITGHGMVSPAPKNSTKQTGVLVYENELYLEGATGIEEIKAGAIDGIPCGNTPDAAAGVYGIRDVRMHPDTAPISVISFWLPASDLPDTSSSVVLGTASGFYGKKYTRITASDDYTLAPLSISATPAAINFKDATYGYSSVAGQKITVKNDSAMDFKNIAASISSADFDIKAGDQPVATLAPGASATITVNPRTLLSAGEHSATLTITSMGVPIGTVALKFIVKHDYQWTTTLSAIDFGFRPVGYTAGAWETFRFVNDSTGDSDITNVSATLTGANTAAYEVKYFVSNPAKARAKDPNGNSVQLRPRTNLPAGSYPATIVLTSKEAKTVTIPVTFTVGSLEITGAKTGDKFTYYASGKSSTRQLRAVVAPPVMSTNKVTWKSSNSSIATVNADGLVTFKGGEGKVKITASVADFPESASVTLESRRNVTSFNTPMTKVYIQRGKTMTLPIALTDSTSPNADFKSKLTWKSSKPSVVKVSASGKVTASKSVIKTTAATVTVTSANGKSFRFKVAVVPKAVKLKSITATFPKNIKAGKSYQLMVKTKDAKATGVKLTFKSSKSSVLKVNSAGKLFVLKKGSAKITIKAGSKQYVKTVKVK
jgi:uncharacterized protein YjdB